MKQILHIFNKDVRRLWPEILVSLAAVLSFVWIYPQSLGEVRGLAALYSWLPGTTIGFIVVSWLLLIVRVIHGEVLVGERQFWITRPYRWHLLMASKLLFLFVFLQVPLFVAQLFVLHICRFHPMVYVWGSIGNVLFMTLIAILPLTAIATMTSNFGKMLLGILFVVIFIAGVAWMNSKLPTSGYSDNYVGMFTSLTTVSVLIAVIVLQYAQRRTAVSRMLTVGTAVAIALLILFGPENLPMRLTYPSGSLPPQVSVDIAFKPKSTVMKEDKLTGPTPDFAREINLQLPLQLKNIQAGTVIQADYMQVAISTADGERWTSHWQSEHAKWLPGQNADLLGLMVNTHFFDRVRGKPVSVSLTLAMTALEAGKPVRLSAPMMGSRIAIPGGGLCTLEHEFSSRLHCLVPLRQPPLMLISSRLSTAKCSGSEPGNGEGDVVEDWIGSLDPSLESGITPVWTAGASLSEQHRANAPEQYLCSGAPLVLTPFTAVWRGQRTTVSAPIHLEEYGALKPWL